MRFIVISIFISLSNFSIGQTSWFKHLSGWRAKSTLAKGDTLLTCGMNSEIKSFGKKYGTFLFWNTAKGDSLDHFRINLDTLENDTTRSSPISYDYYSSILNNESPAHFINLSYGQKKERAFLLKFNNFYSHDFNLEEFTKDTFNTFIHNVILLDYTDIIFLPYVILEKQLERTLNTIIYKETKGKRVKIKEIVNYPLLKYETTCHIKNSKSNASFFFKMREMWDYAGAPRMWADYIIKMDTNGNELWQCFPSNRDSINTEGMQMVQKPNGNLLVSWCDFWYRPYKNMIGSQQPQVNNHCTLWFAEIDSTGKVLWRKQIKQFLSSKIKRDSAQNLVHFKSIATPSGVLWTGYYAWQYSHNYLLKTDFDGNPIWYREYELYPNNTARQEFKSYDVTATSDGSYVLTGEYISDKGNIFKNGCQLATIIKVDSFGCLEPGCQKADSLIGIKTLKKSLCRIYPNPANESVTIEPPYSFKGEYSIKIYSSDGRLVEELETCKSKILNIETYKAGLYLFEVFNKNRNELARHKVSIVR